MSDQDGPAPPPGWCLRAGRPGDADAVAALHVESWRSAYRGILSDEYLAGPIEADRLADWRARLAEPIDPSLILVLAEAGADGLLGFCCIRAGADPRWGSLIDNLHVRPGLSRHRLGRDLLRAAAARIATGPHAGEPLHLTVFDRNTRAIAAYEGWGGALLERFLGREPDGRLHPVRRYGWPDAGRLIGRLAAAD